MKCTNILHPQICFIYICFILDSVKWLPVGNKPVDGRKVFALCQLLVKPPEHLHYTQCGWGYRVREVSTRRWHSSHNTDWSLTVWVTKTLHSACTFIEGCQSCTQVCRVTTEKGSNSNTQRPPTPVTVWEIKQFIMPHKCTDIMQILNNSLHCIKLIP
jgi:hypothetical protein